MRHREESSLGSDFIRLHQLIKGDPQGFEKEVQSYYENFKGQLDIVSIKLSAPSKILSDLVMFLGQVSTHYKKLLEDLPKIIMEFLQKYATLMHPETRLALCRGLILLRNRQLIAPLEMIQLFFSLLSCQDKALRSYLQTHIVSDITNLNSRHHNNVLNNTLQNFMFSQINLSSKTAVKMSLDIMIGLYRKNIWNSAKIVNVIATACFSKITAAMVTALKFFITADEEKLEKEESEGEDNSNVIDIVKANKCNRKTKKRKMLLKRTKKVVKRSNKKNKAPQHHFSAIHLIYDPQEMAEKLLAKVKTLNEGFEVKILMMEMISRLIGIHGLLIPNFYPYLNKLIQPHQREVTKILLFLAQASHPLVPPEDLQCCVQNIANNFVTDRSSVEVMTVGLNAIREVCDRNPHALAEELLQDLVQYRYHKHKNVVMAANSLMKLYREINPKMLNRKDRGKPTQAMTELELPSYGELNAKEFIPGAEVLEEEEEEEDDAGTADVSQEDENDSENEDEEEEGSDDDEEESDHEELDEEEEEEESEGNEKKKDHDSISREAALKQNIAKAIELSHTRIFTQEDFRRMKAAQLAKKVQGALPKKLKRKSAEAQLDETLGSEEDEEESKGDLPSLQDIERVAKKFKVDKETRLATAMEHKANKPKWASNPNTGNNNRMKKKNKPFQMVKHKLKQKAKRSYRQRALDLKKSLMKKKKFTHR